MEKLRGTQLNCCTDLTAPNLIFTSYILHGAVWVLRPKKDKTKKGLTRPSYSIVLLLRLKYICDKSASGMLINPRIVFTFTRQRWSSTPFSSYLALLVWRLNIHIIPYHLYLFHLATGRTLYLPFCVVHQKVKPSRYLQKSVHFQHILDQIWAEISCICYKKEPSILPFCIGGRKMKPTMPLSGKNVHFQHILDQSWAEISCICWQKRGAFYLTVLYWRTESETMPLSGKNVHFKNIFLDQVWSEISCICEQKKSRAF